MTTSQGYIHIESFYYAQLVKLGLREARFGRTLFLVKTHWFFGLLRRCKPKIVAIVWEKPEQDGVGKITGNFRAMIGLKSPIRFLAEAIEREFSLKSQIIINTNFPW